MSAALPLASVRSFRERSVIPGFGLSLGILVAALSLIVLIPLAALVLKAAGVGWSEGWALASSPRTLAALRLSFGAALLAALVNLVFGVLIAWVLVRYDFPGKRFVDAAVDLPFALPTAVAGIALAALYAPNGWIGGLLAPLGIRIGYTPAGVLVALIFIGLPFVVRTVQPVLAEMEAELEEAAALLGASRWRTIITVILPPVLPAAMTGFVLAFARAVGEYGSVIFIAGNVPAVSEIAPLLIVIRLEQFDYAGAALVGVMMLLLSSSSSSGSTSCRPSSGGGSAMSDATLSGAFSGSLPRSRPVRREGALARALLIGAALSFLALFLALPLAIVFIEAFTRGWSAYWAGLSDPDSLAAIQLTLLVAAIAVPINIVIGVAGAWAIAKHNFRGKSLLISLVDLPFSVSPVIAGLVYVLLFGAQGYFGPWLKEQGVQIIFALQGSCWRPCSSPSPSSRAS